MLEGVFFANWLFYTCVFEFAGGCDESCELLVSGDADPGEDGDGDNAVRGARRQSGLPVQLAVVAHQLHL